MPPEYRQLPGEPVPDDGFTRPPVYDEPGPPDSGPFAPPPASPPWGAPPASPEDGYTPPPPPLSTTPGPFAPAVTAVPPAGADVPPPAEGKPSHYRPDIEGLRAVAIIAVLLFHMGISFAQGGFIGVDVFYVISGFLITGLLLREGQSTGKFDLVRFYARRMRRLLPAGLLVIVVTLVLSAFIVTPLRLTEIAGDAAASALYLANFRFAMEATDYLATELPSPLLHYWSLGVEEQFYLLWPLILLLAARFLSLRWVGLIMVLLAGASFGLSLYWSEAQPAWAFFSPFTRAWELAAGALIAVGLLRLPSRLPAWFGGLAVIAGLALIAVGVVLIDASVPYPGVAALLPVAGAVLVVVGGLRGPTLPGRIILSNPLSRYFGHISYSLYLWHWPLLILVPIAIEDDSLTVRVALAGLAIVLAAISTEVVERPFRRSRALSDRSGFTFRLGLSGSVAVGAAALLMSGAITLPSNIPLPWLKPDPVVVELAGVRDDLPALYADGCVLEYPDRKLKPGCIYGDPEGERTAMLIGNSHAAQWMPALDVYARKVGWRLEVENKSACALPDVPVWERRLRRTFDECIAWRESLMKRIARTEPDIVFVGVSRDYDLWDNSRIVQSNQALGYWQQKLTELLETIRQSVPRVVLLAETPFLNYDPVDCLADPDISNCDPARSLVLDDAYARLEAAAAADAGADLLSINRLLCPGATCPVVVDDIVVLRDKHHLTASYMERLAAPIGRILEGKSPYPSPSPSGAPAAATPGA